MYTLLEYAACLVLVALVATLLFATCAFLLILKEGATILGRLARGIAHDASILVARKAELIRTKHLKVGSLLVLMFLLVPVPPSRGLPLQTPADSTQQSGQGAQITVLSRAVNPLYKGEQGKQRSEIEFTTSSRTVTLKLLVQDPNGYFLPNLRRENFAVHEDGVRQKNVMVEIEHASISVALLMELGGRYHELNKVLGTTVPQTGRQLLDVVGRDDKIAIFKYDSKLETLAGFDQGHEVLDSVFDHIATPGISEVNFYDAILEILNRMREVGGRYAESFDWIQGLENLQTLGIRYN